MRSFDILIEICNLLGVSYSSGYLSSLTNECEKINYLLVKIKEFIGG